jgi:hypothetical protein
VFLTKPTRSVFEVGLRLFVNVEVNEQLFGFSNGLTTNQKLGKLVGVPLFLRWRVRGSTR